MIFARVVCGIDGSPEGLEALRQAVSLHAKGGRLLALTVCETYLAVHTGFEAARWAGTLREEAEEARRQALVELGNLPLAHAQVVEGRPVPALLAAATDERASLIAVGWHGRGRPAGILLGSVATAMLHEAPCPVLVARAATGRAWSPGSVVVGVDGSPQSLEALDTAAALAGRFGARVRAVAASGGKPIDVAALDSIDPLELDERNAVTALVEASANADLVIVGGRGLHGVAALGSVSERVAHRASCSVLVVRPLVDADAAEPIRHVPSRQLS